MTINELIEKLQQYKGSMTVMVNKPEEWLGEIEDVTIAETSFYHRRVVALEFNPCNGCLQRTENKY
jgi:hypothetical protein